MSPRHARDPILDAARATVLDLGVRRATVSEVARRASVSRMTVYRRYPDGAALIRALMTREFGAVLEEAGAAAAHAPTARERLVRSVVRTVEVLRQHPLLERLLELDPELLLPYLVTRPGRFQVQAREAGAELVAEGQADGSIRPGDPAELAATVEVAARGFVFGAEPPPVEQLERLLEAYLRPAAGEASATGTESDRAGSGTSRARTGSRSARSGYGRPGSAVGPVSGSEWAADRERAEARERAAGRDRRSSA